MNWMHELFWWLLIAAGVVSSGLFSGLETGVYSLNRVRLHVRAHRPRSHGAILASLVDKPAALLTSLLIATNIATNIATSSMAVILHGRGLNPWQVTLVDVVVMTPLTCPSSSLMSEAMGVLMRISAPEFSATVASRVSKTSVRMARSGSRKACCTCSRLRLGIHWRSVSTDISSKGIPARCQPTSQSAMGVPGFDAMNAIPLCCGSMQSGHSRSVCLSEA